MVSWRRATDGEHHANGTSCDRRDWVLGAFIPWICGACAKREIRWQARRMRSARECARLDPLRRTWPVPLYRELQARKDRLSCARRILRPGRRSLVAALKETAPSKRG